ncbi:MAG: cytochrome c biogenesis protein CcsA, partial [Bacteroidales bacterium]
VFLTINLCKPELHDATLMPALQSVWFAPHVGVYMFAYALAGASFILALYGLLSHKQDPKLLKSADNLVYIALAFLNIGMILGAVWGKAAWGHFWNWDAKETWALLTCLLYSFYIHYRLQYPTNKKTAYIVLIIAFIALQICWYGVKYLPAAGGSLHLYGG